MSSPPTTTPTADRSDETATAVLLGASNVARCLPSALLQSRAALAHLHPELPSRLLVAAGRGRSYNNTSWVLGRSLPGILPSGLWPALKEAPGPAYAVVTDIGNDLVYGASVRQILGWVRRCLDHFHDVDARIVLTLPALDNLDRYPMFFLEAFRKVIFPKGDVHVPAILERAEALSHDLRDLCARRDIPCLEQPSQWYGLDPIHYRLKLRHNVWNGFVRAWHPALADLTPRQTLKKIYWQAWPEAFGFGTRALERSQPCVHLPDGTPVSLF